MLALRVTVLALAASALACSSDTRVLDPVDGGSGGSGGSGGAGGSGGSSEPVLRFFVDDRPHDPANEEVETDHARYTDPVRVTATGLVPGSRARFDVLSGDGQSWALFEVGGDGSVDFARDAPLDGSWTGADADGFLWSLDLGAALDVDVVVTDEADSVLAEATLVRAPFNDTIVSEVVDDGTLVGTFYHPVGAGPFPALLVFGGSEGGRGTGEFLAAYAATLGYAALGVAYFGEPGLPAVLTDVPIEILEGDLAALRARPEVDVTRIGVWGGSRGGELALILAARDPLLRAVVADVPSGYVWGSAAELARAAWTSGGEELVYLPSSGAMAEVWVEADGTHVAATPAALADIAAATPAEREAARTRVEDAEATFLLVAGADDQLWPSCVLSEVAMDALVASGHAAEHGDELHCYLDAGHWIGLPGSSTMSSQRYYDGAGGYWLELGGTPPGTAAAQRAANTNLRAFLERTLTPDAP